MSAVLISLILIALVVTFVFWYFTRDYRSIPDDRIINLATDEDRILGPWYQHHLKPSIEISPSDHEIAAQLLDRLYGLKIEPSLLVIGEDLTKFTNLSEQIFDLRRVIGKSGQIAIINNERVRKRVRRSINYDTSSFKAIMDQDLDTIAKNYLEANLKYRWDKINQVPDLNIVNNEGSYLYLRQHSIPNIETKEENGIHRINLLCTDLEFETLIQRWTKSLNNTSMIN